MGIGLIAAVVATTVAAEDPGVCSTRYVELVKSLGADQVIDYTQADFTQTRHTYDITFEAVGKSSFAQ